MKKVITIDIDNVLCDTAGAFLKYYAQRYGDDVRYDQLTQPYIQDNAVFAKRVDETSDDRGGAYMRFFEYVHTEDALLPLSGAEQGVRILSESGYILYGVTGRVDAQQPLTYQRVDRYFGDMFEEIYFANDDGSTRSISKGELCQQVGSSVHIDDFLHYVQTISAAGIASLLLAQPRNTSYDNTDPLIQRVGSRDEIVRSVQEICKR